MRLKIFSYLPPHAPHTEDVPPHEGIFNLFAPGFKAGDQKAVNGVLDGLGGRSVADKPWMGELQSHYYVWQNLLTLYDYVGFERLAQPFFVDTMPLRRLRAEFPEVAKLRAKYWNAWGMPNLHADEAVRAEYLRMRAAMDDGDEGRIAAWIGRADIVVSPAKKTNNILGHRASLGPSWERLLEIAVKFKAFSNLLDEKMMPDFQPYAANNYIIRSDIFALFAPSLFEVLFEFKKTETPAHPFDVVYLAERLWGVFLQRLRLENPLLRVAELPSLSCHGDVKPDRLPEDFDKQGYLVLNPDIAASGADPQVHFLEFGWREDRDWRL